jgi:hypothetical protein
MYPHERSLVNRMKDRPFALLGINSDRDREKIRKTCQEKDLTWRSWWDQSTSGQIARSWNVSGWPTVYIIDHKGVIRAKSVGFQDFDALIEKLVAAAEAEVSVKD